ncbi:MFS transporter [Acinetobacter variabilis]|uniref:MFS transporter n=1 Tax=Acinetobacter variabilis TaxID=70346 RepID=UPI0028A8DD9D|nr:MFS transporter [Acinetobacter variabilis]
MSAQGQISRKFMFMMAMTCALCAGCNYFNQPLIYSIAEDLHISVAESGWTVVLTQIGYATGLFLFVPLGDLFEKRLYICSLMLCTGLALIGLSASTNLHMLYGFTLLASFCSITTQILIPFAANLSQREKSAEVVGLLMSGVLVGILFARTVSGLISTLWSWHAVYLLSGCSILLLSIAMWYQLPKAKSQLQMSILQIYRSLFTFAKTEPMLIRRSIIGGLGFGMLSIIFTTMTFVLAEAPYHFNDFQIGLMGIVGVVGIWSSQWTGKMIGRHREKWVAQLATTGLILAWIPLFFAQSYLWVYIIGLIPAYFGISSLHVLNQNLVYRISVQARSRINAIYMTCYFSGAGLGAFLSLHLWKMYSWSACVALGFIFALLIFSINRYDLSRKRNLVNIHSQS